MIIQQSTAYSVQSARSSAAVFQPTRQAVSGAAAKSADTITISKTGREAAASESVSIPPGEYPIEYYGMPLWMADYYPVILSDKLGGTWDETFVKGANLVGKFDAELSEYGGLLNKHLQTLTQKEGLDTLPKLHQAMVADKENSERLRLQLKDSIAGDKRMTELMGVLGIQLPG